MAEAISPLDRNDQKFLSATVGEKIVLSFEGRKEELFVSKLTNTGLVLEYPNEGDFTRDTGGETGPRESSFLHDASGVLCMGEFYMAPLTFKIMETAVIDGLTALGPALFGNREVMMTGLPLVSNFTFFCPVCNT